MQFNRPFWSEQVTENMETAFYCMKVWWRGLKHIKSEEKGYNSIDTQAVSRFLVFYKIFSSQAIINLYQYYDFFFF